LVRLKVLIADPKVDVGGLNLDPRVMQIFRSVILRWKKSIIRPIYFEKVVSLCKEEEELESSNTKEAGNDKTSKTGRNSSMKSQTSSPGAGKQAEASLVTSEMLSACLDIFTALTEEAPENDFLADNADQLQAVLGSCFRHVCDSDSLDIRLKIRKFIVGLYRTSVRRIHVYEQVLLFINASLEKLIFESERLDNEKGADSSIAEFSLQIIEEVSRHSTDYFMTFSSSLLSLGNRLVKKHLADTTAKQRQGASHSQQSGLSGIPQMYATPTAGILDEACVEDLSFGMSSVTTKPAPPKHGSHSRDAMAVGSPLRSLVVILRMLGASDMPFVFSEDRKSLFHIISSILDGSDNVQLLMTAVKVVGTWLLADRSGGAALTVKERSSFLWKIASFDFFNGLPDVDAQPLADLVAHYVITFFGRKWGGNENDEDNLQIHGNTGEGLIQKCSENEDIILNKSLVACLLNANTRLRHALLHIFRARGSYGFIGVLGEAMQTHDKSSSTPRTASDVLWQLLHSDFEGLGGRCWLVVFVELFLSSSNLLGGIKLDTYGKEKCWLPAPAWKESERSDDGAIDQYVLFCTTLKDQIKAEGNGRLECLDALRSLAQFDISICKMVFNALLPAAWDQISSDGKRLKLLPALEALLARPFHSQLFRQSKINKQDEAPTNAVRMFANSMLELRPMPYLNATLLVSIAENYNCWFEVLTLLERQYAVLIGNPKLAEEKLELAELTLSAMRHCYRQLGDDLWMGLAYESCVIPESRWALSFDLHGMINEASDAYIQLVNRYQRDEESVQGASDFELNMWEARWLECQRELCQQGVVSEFATLSGNQRLLLESAWKSPSPDWDKVRELVASPPLVAAVEKGDPEVKICEILLAVADGKLSDVENSHAQAAQLCLYRWQQLPKISRGSQSHAALLHSFHRLVEIRESGQIMVETSNHSKTGRTLPDLKNLLK